MKKKKQSVPSVPKDVCAVPSVPEDTSKLKLLLPHEKVRFMSLQLYCSPERWSDVLATAERYIYIYHDKDNSAPHYHLILKFTNPRFRSAIEKLFNLEGLTQDTTINFQKVRNLASAVAYLTHDTPEARKENKYHYSTSELVSNDLGYFLSTANSCCSSSLTNMDFVDDICSNLGYRALAEKYGRDYIKNYRTYSAFAEEVKKEDARALKEFQKKEDIKYFESLGIGASPDDFDALADFIVRNYIDFSACDLYSDTRSLNNFMTKLRQRCELKISEERIHD